jgi:NADPH-dependent 2,4-dienoyl-CoA reductase/sulfur reductase-like enzyme
MSFERETDLAVVGGGPAGLSAALAAAGAGLRVIVIDEYPQPGGQFYKQLSAGFVVTDRTRLPYDYTKGDALLARVREASIDVLNEALVCASFDPGSFSVRHRGELGTIRWRSAVVATGAYERAAVFPGWDLPGVMTPGGAQTLVKTQQVFPGQRIVLAGSGPFLMPVAATLIEAGANIIGIYEATRPTEWVRHATGVFGHRERMAEAVRYWRTIRGARVPVRFGYVVVRAEGTEAVERVVLMQCDREGAVVPGTERVEHADTLCASYGFVPAVQVTRALGCEHRYDARKGGWIPVHDDAMQTSVPHVYVAGEVAGIGGAHAAMAEGRLAGLNAARELGKDVSAATLSDVQRARAQHRTFAALVADVFALKPRVRELITDETIVCRCEEVNASAVRSAALSWGANVNFVKGITRCGMGYCQGRICGPLVEDLTAATLGLPPGSVDSFHVRPPIKPLTVRELAQAASNWTGDRTHPEAPESRPSAADRLMQADS